MDRKVRRHTQVADALRYSLLPSELPGVPGVEVATTHLAATENPEVGGDFFDVYRTLSGWGVAIGDVCGRGEGVVTASAAARHAIRVLAHSTHDPAEVLSRANQIILAEQLGGRFVTACAAHVRWREESLEVMLGSAGHPAPLLLRPDGELRQLRGGGQPLGIFPDAGPGLEQHDLSPATRSSSTATGSPTPTGRARATSMTTCRARSRPWLGGRRTDPGPAPGGGGGVLPGQDPRRHHDPRAAGRRAPRPVITGPTNRGPAPAGAVGAACQGQAGPAAAAGSSPSSWSRRYRSARASSRETCIWEIPSCSPISAWVMLP